MNGKSVSVPFCFSSFQIKKRIDLDTAIGMSASTGEYLEVAYLAETPTWDLSVAQLLDAGRPGEHRCPDCNICRVGAV